MRTKANVLLFVAVRGEDIKGDLIALEPTEDEIEPGGKLATERKAFEQKTMELDE